MRHILTLAFAFCMVCPAFGAPTTQPASTQPATSRPDIDGAAAMVRAIPRAAVTARHDWDKQEAVRPLVGKTFRMVGSVVFSSTVGSRVQVTASAPVQGGKIMCRVDVQTDEFRRFADRLERGAVVTMTGTVAGVSADKTLVSVVLRPGSLSIGR